MKTRIYRPSRSALSLYAFLLLLLLLLLLVFFLSFRQWHRPKVTSPLLLEPLPSLMVFGELSSKRGRGAHH